MIRNVPGSGGWLEVICGPMFSGKSEELIRRLRRRDRGGNYVLRAVNYASVTTTFTMTARVYELAGEDVFGGNIVESYKLTCERPDGTVLQTAQVTVDRGRTQRVDLGECQKRFR